MTAYGSFYFFAIVGILLIPTIVAGLRGKMLRKYNAVLTLIMLAIIFSDKSNQAMMLVVFIIWQYVLIKGYLLLRKQNNNTFMFCMAIILSILPLILAKIAPFVPELKFIVFTGISYVTFRAVQMVFEIRDGLIIFRPDLSIGI
ncbi:membrane bound O-acyl transferase MBOAT family protein, partial [Bacillus mycoides FSL H7-687]